MRKYSCLILDDDAIFLDGLHEHLSKFEEFEIVGVCDNSFDARKILTNRQVDLLFTDIEMPDLSGIELLKSLSVKPLFIFITSHPGFAIEGFDLDAIDYIVKPALPERIYKAAQKAIDLLKMKEYNSGEQEQNFKKSSSDSFFIKVGHEFVKLAADDVLYIESMADFVNIFTLDGKKYIVLVNLKNLEQQLPGTNFMRISRTHIINRKYINSLTSGQINLRGNLLGIGNTFKDKVMEEVVGDNVIKRYN